VAFDCPVGFATDLEDRLGGGVVYIWHGFHVSEIG
jgi:hypothetical protein